MKVSIIVPVYNAAPFLDKCIKSIVNQTYKNLEILLVNDGSTDNSLEILKGFEQFDKRVLLIDKINGGIGTAYKAAFETMSGDSVFFVDSDDWLELNAIEELVKLMIKYDVDYVAMNMSFTQHLDGHTFYEKDELVEGDDIMHRQFVHYQHSSICRLHRKKLFNNVVVFDQNIGIDAQLTPQLLFRAKRGYITKQSFYNTLVRSGSISRSITISEKQIKDTMRVYNFIIEYMNQNISKYTPYMRLRYIDSLLAMCKGALFVSKKDFEPYLSQIIKEIEENYKELKKAGLYQNKRIIDKIQIGLILHMKGTFKFLVQLQLFTKLGFYK